MSLHAIEGGCECGANSYQVVEQPITRFKCHCKICQAYTQKPFSDVMVFLRKDVKNIRIKYNTFKRYRKPPNIRRGTCTKCNKPTIEYGVLGQLVFIPASNLKDQHQSLIPASMHVFYDSRVEDIPDQLPKYEGYLRSHLAIGVAAAQHFKK